MPGTILRYESTEKIFGLRSDSRPYDLEIAQWRIFERYEPGAHDRLEQGLGSYRIVMEKSVASESEARDALEESRRIVDEIDTAWCYVCGKPFKTFGSTIQTLSYESPEGWTGNFQELSIAFQKEQHPEFLVAASQAVGTDWLWLLFLPLQKVLLVRECYLKAPPIIKDLIELHIHGHKTHRGRLFYFAKALELAGREFGHSKKDRNEGLQAQMARIGVERYLTQTVEWLFDLANNRFEIRHAVAPDPTRVALHPRLSHAEARDWHFNADLVIRAFVSEKLGVDVCV